ncbi:DUF1189 family protein [Candidatus Daviesbacteria bacterium]|nr:DUF1189 family protein [Candidatus Daviesbacteria bacterium]
MIQIWLLAKAFKHALKYKQAYIISLHAITLSLIVELILMLVRGFSGYIGFPFMFTIITLLVVAINLFLDKTAKS